MSVLLWGRFRFFLAPLWGDSLLSLIRRNVFTLMRHLWPLPVAVQLLPGGMFPPTLPGLLIALPRSSQTLLAGLERTRLAVLISMLTASADDHLLAAPHAQIQPPRLPRNLSVPQAAGQVLPRRGYCSQDLSPSVDKVPEAPQVRPWPGASAFCPS